MREKVMQLLRTVIDPELHCNIVDLGLVYQCNVVGNEVDIHMTLTTPACPFALFLESQVIHILESQGYEVHFQYTFDPAWDSSLMTEELRFEKGLL